MKVLKNTKGQAAIFVVLIFQFLFILFAMSINVAMVVYDKINLQNSLDMAVYYGAKKQSEVLNAMAHINYQMRQNWKLLAWRYRILGTLAQYDGYHNRRRADYWCPQNSNGGTQCRDTSASECRQAQQAFGANVYGGDYCDWAYFVCISHGLWRRGISSDSQNLCTKHDVDIATITDLNSFPGWMSEAVLAQTAVEQLRREVGQSCPAEGAVNWLMTQFFMTHFRLDQKDRKVMLQEIYNKTLKAGKDLEGEKIFEGAKKVFCGNLSHANQKSLRDLCGTRVSSNILQDYSSFRGKDFKDIFEKVNVWPVLQFLYYTGNGNGNGRALTCPADITSHYQDTINGNNIFDSVESILENTSPDPHPLAGFLDQEVKKLFDFNSIAAFSRESRDPLRDLTLSFIKKKDQILYYALRLEFDYKQDQVFSLNLSDPIKFKASAFAKAFGASFGPQPQQFDPLIPVFHPQANVRIPNSRRVNNALLQPNYSRWPGDKWGLIDYRLHDNDVNGITDNKLNFLNKHKEYPSNVGRVYSMEDYFHLTLDRGEADDPLARRLEDDYDPFHFTRIMELMAVYPDLYDISYYSILGNYHQTYFKKICRLLKNSDCDKTQRNRFLSQTGREVYIRGDFGWPSTDIYLSKNYSERQREISIAPYFLYNDSEKAKIDLIEYPNDKTESSPNGRPPSARNWGSIVELDPPNPNPPPLSQGNLFYPWLARSDSGDDKARLPDGLLSSWTNSSPLNYKEYDFPARRFLECQAEAQQSAPVPSACASGGRSGYSVKLISCSAVRAFSNQPSDIDDYCPP